MRFARYETMDMILIHFPLFNEKMGRKADLNKACFYRISSLSQQRFTLFAHKDDRIDTQKRGMVFCTVIHDRRALTLCMVENFGMGLRSTLAP